MVRKLKNALYFLVAGYFRFFARIRLQRWSPKIVVVTGSNGKTTALNLLEVQLGTAAKYSHGANSSFGIPFDILGLKRKSYGIWEWPFFALRAPFAAWKKPHAEKIYIVEADCDRPYEGKFLSELLQPEVTIWLSCARTHTANFDKSVNAHTFATVDEAIAHEFGNFVEHTSKLVIVNANEPLIEKELPRTRATISSISEARNLQSYTLNLSGTEFILSGIKYHVPFLLPKEVFYAVAASVQVAEYFDKKPTSDLWKLELPAGRSSLLRGIKHSTIVDSSYNANVASVSAILRMVRNISGTKWLILGDLTEQGAEEKEEHEKIARMIVPADFQKIILVGPRLTKYALPILGNRAMAFEQPRDALDHIVKELTGGEVLIFKGARFLEGIIEHLLADKADVAKLCRREKVWQKRRAQWGL